MYNSETYGKLELSQIPEKINEYYEKMKLYDTPIHIIVGTDSQNFDKTKLVSVIAVYCEGHGGIYFYEISRIDKIKDVRVKLHVETGESLKITTDLVDLLENYPDLFMNTTLSIHIDAGLNPNGKTRELIPELVGWIKSCGYDCETKPDSWVASTIADRISK
ncbi:MAG: ribonuclease H-like YkuK family protein [Lachnospiraceae bacterium]|nr:ribonuclease H-like YkuK family protein [Lachnospiraceae bacterium]